MTCPRLEETSALFDGELGALEAEGARAHVTQCAECARFEADLLRLRASLRDLGASNPVEPAPWWRRRIAIPLPVLANLVLAVVVLAAALLVRAPRPAAVRPAPSFEAFDAGRPPVVYVRPRSAR